jgi:hypothetical protein
MRDLVPGIPSARSKRYERRLQWAAGMHRDQLVDDSATTLDAGNIGQALADNLGPPQDVLLCLRRGKQVDDRYAEMLRDALNPLERDAALAVLNH